MYFVHLMVQGADLVSGGPGRRWRLTRAGDDFLALSPALQVSSLFAGWWFCANWLLVFPWAILGDVLPGGFNAVITKLLLAQPVNQSMPFEPFADHVIQTVGWTWPRHGPDTTRSIVWLAIGHVVIAPLKELGILSTARKPNPELPESPGRLVAFTITGFGRALLEAVGKQPH